ncbi:MAG: DJ-1/PfpI family protein, partial [Planctomycetota bacterium JB042]
MTRGLLALAFGLAACGSEEAAGPASERAAPAAPGERPLLAAFLIEDGTYNSELTAPMDILHHTPFHAPPGIEVVTVAPTREPIRTFEGLVIRPDHDYASAPPIDILVVPSAERHVDADFDDPALVEFVRSRGSTARWVMSLCDGAFVLGRAGLLDGKTCTTFPGDLAALRERFPAARVVDGVTFVVDGALVTGVGGARSFEPALWLVERLYGELPARGVARGMVIDWHLESERYLDVDDADPDSIGFRAGDRIDPDVTVLDEDGEVRRLLDLAAEDDRVVVLTLFGGGD